MYPQTYFCPINVDKRTNCKSKNTYAIHHFTSSWRSSEEMKKWFRWIESNRPALNHYSIFEDGNYCGESFYEIDTEHQSAALDIKLFGFARGRGIAAAGLSYAVQEAFRNGARIVWVDPNPENKKAIALYKKLGFRQKDFPEYLISGEGAHKSIYMERRHP